MTYEEAIEILRDTPIDIRSTREDDIHTLYATAQLMAIEALEKSEELNRGTRLMWESLFGQMEKDNADGCRGCAISTEQEMRTDLCIARSVRLL